METIEQLLWQERLLKIEINSGCLKDPNAELVRFTSLCTQLNSVQQKIARIEDANSSVS